jgi:hypothetical protein
MTAFLIVLRTEFRNERKAAARESDVPGII